MILTGCLERTVISDIFHNSVWSFQNHRRYVRSRDDAQLRGDLSQSVAGDCKPYAKREDSNNVTKAIAPCGTIANSLFNGKNVEIWQII
jgi:hypothetical protein